MSDIKERLLQRIEDDRDLLITYLREFIRCRSPNPPGDTVEAARHVTSLLEKHSIDYRIVAPNSLMPNIIASFEGASPGRHLAINGHIDVFPVGDGEGWTVDPWGGELVDGKIYGRGACDMKSGTTASIFTFIYLQELREKLCGRLTMSVVSDEETFGPWGARYLFDHHPEVIGDCCLNGEPSGPETYRFGEKGPLWLRFFVRTHGAHGAYIHRSKSATSIAAQIVSQLEEIQNLSGSASDNVSPMPAGTEEIIDAAWGAGAARNLRRITVNPGLLQGGVKVNMVAAQCTFEVDIRLPIGLDDALVIRRVEEIVSRYPEVRYERILYNPPNWSPPDTEMASYVRANARAASGTEPIPVVSLGCTDARLWRYRDVPAVVFGPSPIEMGGVNEFVHVEEFINVVKTHVLSAFDYMSRKSN